MANTIGAMPERVIHWVNPETFRANAKQFNTYPGQTEAYGIKRSMPVSREKIDGYIIDRISPDLFNLWLTIKPGIAYLVDELPEK